MRFLLTVVLLVAVVMIVANASRNGRRRHNRNNRRYGRPRAALRNASCRRVKNAGVCERCCDPCEDVVCTGPLTCDMGVCNCNGTICDVDQTCTGTGDGASCTDNCNPDCILPLTCDGGECKCAGIVCDVCDECTETPLGPKCMPG